MKHAPGPWYWYKGLSYGELGSTIFSEKGHELAKMVFITPELDSSARLMAAAPELLEALETLTQVESGDLVGVEWKVAVTEACKNANKAIAKARGGGGSCLRIKALTHQEPCSKL